MGTRVIMPLLGESVIEGKISQWLKQVGDHVKLYEPILEVETDKVTTEVAANGEGTLLKTYFDEGEVVKVGTLIAFLGEPNEVPPDEGGAEHKEQAAQPQAVPAMTAVASAQRGGNGSGTRVSPVVARIAAEHNIDVSALTGTGEGGRVTKKDILAYIDSGASTAASAAASLPAQTQPVVPAPAVMPGETIALNSMRRSIAEHMVMSKRTSPHVTTVFEVDLSRVVTHRNANQAAFERDGAKLTFTPYFAAATVAALKAHPLVNSSWSEAGIVLHRAINLGIAVSLGAEGLIVPVIKNADSMNLLGLARAVNDLADRARRKQLKPDEVQGGTFTITNHGTSGSLFATPIINQPQCGILGVGKIEKRVVVVTQDGVDSIAIKPMVFVGLTFDHRILDGNSADNFVATIKQALESWT
jgi:pyruvate/2-oxoglutarate dehydrogenase complex dihydrolipoamide acyltransferase (E2) component